MKWQPIETAPKDGTKILLAKFRSEPLALWWACSGGWSSAWKNWNDGFEPIGLADDPSHWMPLPETLE